MRIIRNVKDYFFKQHLFTTNVLTCGSLLGLGDCMVQKINTMFEENIKYDFARTGRMAVIGVMLGPFNHYWYAILDRIIVGRTRKIVVKKILVDQAVAGPFFCTSFLYGISILEGKDHDAAKQEWKNKFLKIYMLDWTFWPLAQFINFKFVPSNYRVLYVCISTLIWNSLLSYIKYRPVHEHVR
ncbi:unnamed protein product [Candidula unifasciata]|uniref:Mpv17-like protein 2 n=1 Tax=Candidula unifasciata TaxID=100452 RepID=A0A8S4A4Y3_9EUPU|nr:unnamed protein product [Candidula unifasciata]